MAELEKEKRRGRKVEAHLDVELDLSPSVCLPETSQVLPGSTFSIKDSADMLSSSKETSEKRKLDASCWSPSSSPSSEGHQSKLVYVRK